ncbi:hypothetical protein BDV36DRAFT_263831 [Aspergillus pseudocaelatus]|uniref:Uncharacterized protein n=1 Tax=Aspergillus pseudocaelatus TaxID=1825620 RepID=A0ABQ6WHH5_9EURO|nr:hypothetical protein BDV36DRAFT_263831 [Aspergillus pseudocaelatus]
MKGAAISARGVRFARDRCCRSRISARAILEHGEWWRVHNEESESMTPAFVSTWLNMSVIWLSMLCPPDCLLIFIGCC